MKCSKKRCKRETLAQFKTCEKCRTADRLRQYRKYQNPEGKLVCNKCKTRETEGILRLCETCRGLRKLELLQYRTGWLQKHPLRGLLASAKWRAKQDSIPFDIVEADISIPSHCPVLGIPLFKSMGCESKHQPNSPSLDRLIPELGYVRGNVAVISFKANMLKSDETDPQTFRRLADWLEAAKKNREQRTGTQSSLGI